ncbi:MAG: PIN domain-containing protein [Candidatus Micrarchaeia archaeon]
MILFSKAWKRKTGLPDSIILATAQKHGLKILTGDKHFKNVKEVEVLMI